MSRVIKFRAIIPQRNATIIFTLQDLIEWKFSNREILWPWLAAGNTPDQFTGITDRNGVEVYEGDVVTAHYFYFEGGAEADGTHTGVVTYSEWASFGIDAGGNHGWLEIGETTQFEEPCIEVIGNKYEHPHLLEAKP